MSRSRRRVRPLKCVCGRRLVPFTDDPRSLGCPILDYVHEHNEQLRRFKLQKARP